MPSPPLGLVLRAAEVPSVGGDTCFASMYAAYDALSPAMQAFASGLLGVHSISMSTERHKGLDDLSRPDETEWPPVEHPVVCTHPDTGRRYLFVNCNWTERIANLTDEENDLVLPFLLKHVESPEFQCRLRWEPGTVALIENRAAQHYGVPDYQERRVLQRMMVLDEPPTLVPA
jgi:taurine dioxygenase